MNCYTIISFSEWVISECSVLHAVQFVINKKLGSHSKIIDEWFTGYNAGEARRATSGIVNRFSIDSLRTLVDTRNNLPCSTWHECIRCT